jgi:hypothetical protein
MRQTSDVARRGAVAGVAALLVGCTEGYPSQDAPPFEPERWSQAQRLEQLRAIGNPRGAAVRWRYTLETSCRLAVERKPRWGSADRVEVALRRVDVGVRAGGEDAAGFVVVAHGADDTRTTLYAGTRRVDVMHAATLVKLLQRDCVEVLLTRAQLPVQV